VGGAAAIKTDPVEAPEPIDGVLEEVKKNSEVQTEPDLSDCIHVMNPDRMTDVPGMTMLGKGEDKDAEPMPVVRSFRK
jgi:hypothetical protein